MWKWRSASTTEVQVVVSALKLPTYQYNPSLFECPMTPLHDIIRVARVHQHLQLSPMALLYYMLSYKLQIHLPEADSPLIYLMFANKGQMGKTWFSGVDGGNCGASLDRRLRLLGVGLDGSPDVLRPERAFLS